MTRTRRLTEVELRVAGALMEKEQTTPDAYPMTVNALRAACNQKTNRDPVTDLGEEAVRDALESLRQDVLVWRSSGARAERWEHRLASRWELNRQEKAVLTLLILRGPQTPGELRTRSERMTDFASVNAVVSTLNTMREGDHPLVRELSRAPGQSATRWDHLVGKDSPKATAGEVAGCQPNVPASEPVANGDDDRFTQLEARVSDLTKRLESLETALGVNSEADTP